MFDLLPTSVCEVNKCINDYIPECFVTPDIDYFFSELCIFKNSGVWSTKCRNTPIVGIHSYKLIMTIYILLYFNYSVIYDVVINLFV